MVLSRSPEIAPKLAEVFDFYVYLSEKNDEKRVVQAPPAFTFMPYYIDQDNGWTELYNSFERMNQFSKQERAKSLYFHLNLSPCIFYLLFDFFSATLVI